MRMHGTQPNDTPPPKSVRKIRRVDYDREAKIPEGWHIVEVRYPKKPQFSHGAWVVIAKIADSQEHIDTCGEAV
jgi:hypothetical protein